MTMVSIASMGARTPVGLNAWSSAAAVLAGVSRLREHGFMVDRAGEPYVLACDRSLGAAAHTQRLSTMAADVLAQIFAPRRRLPASKRPLRVYLALPECDARFTPASVEEISQSLVREFADGQPVEVLAVPRGHAAGVEALQAAMQAIAQDATAPVAVVGVDSYIDAEVLDNLEHAGRVMSASTKYGFPPGEGAGALLLAAPAVARAIGDDLAQVVSAESDHEAQAMLLDEPVCTGEGLGRAWSKALRRVPFPAERIAHIYADVTGERYRGRELAYTMGRVPYAAFRELEDYTTAVDAWGDVGAATIPLLAVLAVAAGRFGRTKGELVLLSASSVGGGRGAAVLQVPSTRGGRT